MALNNLVLETKLEMYSYSKLQITCKYLVRKYSKHFIYLIKPQHLFLVCQIQRQQKNYAEVKNCSQ